MRCLSRVRVRRSRSRHRASLVAARSRRPRSEWAVSPSRSSHVAVPVGPAYGVAQLAGPFSQEGAVTFRRTHRPSEHLLDDWGSSEFTSSFRQIATSLERLPSPAAAWGEMPGSRVPALASSTGRAISSWSRPNGTARTAPRTQAPSGCCRYRRRSRPRPRARATATLLHVPP